MGYNTFHKKTGVLMSEYTSMKVGGPAGEFYIPNDKEELLRLVSCLKDDEKPYILLGNGTNIIVRDGGYPGAVILTLKALCGIGERSGEAGSANSRLVCGAGESLSKACRLAADRGFSGLEELSGIPGTVGGAVFMNAGAYGREISDVLISVHAYDPVDGNNIMLTKEDCMFAYRTSVFKSAPLVILAAEFSLAKGNPTQIKTKMAEYNKKRNEKQPVDMPSAGSFFKRPEGEFAGRLIEKAGLKGARVGGAQVSGKHAGFIVNTGGATAGDVLELAEKVRIKVYDMFGIRLEEEPIVIGI